MIENNMQIDLFAKINREITLSGLQNYFSEVLCMRGFGQENVEEKMLLLIEEVGELAKALRKEEGNLGIDYCRINNYDSVKSEIADVLIVLISICNLKKIDLFEAIYDKEKNNIERRWKK